MAITVQRVCEVPFKLVLKGMGANQAFCKHVVGRSLRHSRVCKMHAVTLNRGTKLGKLKNTVSGLIAVAEQILSNGFAIAMWRIFSTNVDTKNKKFV
ncbi:MAG: hypothetical protein IPJ93_00040 [Bacteroidota bacterium]|nr:MAG: hypothetical protein IPJ93_00040 [Bacteroidota bacterium]